MQPLSERNSSRKLLNSGQYTPSLLLVKSRRCEAWEKLTGVDKIFDENCLDITNEKNIIDLLETAVMLMEGASEDDIKTIRTPIVKSETDGCF